MNINQQVWQRFEAASAMHAPRWLSGLRPPATQVQVMQVEAELGLRLPDELRYAYLRHDGQELSYEAGHELFFRSYAWLPLADMTSVWRMLVTVADEQRDMWTTILDVEDSSGKVLVQLPWYPAWVPIGNDGAGGYCFADLCPGRLGTRGQLVSQSDPVPVTEANVFATGLNDYLSRLTGCLERGVNPSTFSLTD